jgi:hypothetical protein
MISCLVQTGEGWSLVGVSAWRKGCGSVGERPRLYDRVSLTTEWAARVINQVGMFKAAPIRTM